MLRRHIRTSGSRSASPVAVTPLETAGGLNKDKSFHEFRPTDAIPEGMTMPAETPSAFPPLPSDGRTLPSIPGGWKTREYPLPGFSVLLNQPADPDQFLEDPQVHRQNELNDYMPYWAFLWPAAVKMAACVATADWPPGSRILELGTGLGLVGLAALKAGHRVTFSDYDETALHLCRANALLNGLPEPETWRFDWRDPPQAKFPLIIGCEVTYDAPTHGALLAVVDAMLEPDGVCWLGDPGRFQATAFLERARHAGFTVDIQDALGNAIEIPSSQGFQILKLKRRRD